MDAVARPLTLTTEETEVLSRLREGSPPGSSRAAAILALAEGGDLDSAVGLSGLTAGQVRYWLGRFRSRRIAALVATVASVEHASVPQADGEDPGKAAAKSKDKKKPKKAAKSAMTDKKRSAGSGKKKDGKKPAKPTKRDDKKSATKKKATKKAAAKEKPTKRPAKKGRNKNRKK